MIDIDRHPDFLWDSAQKIAKEKNADILLLNATLFRPVCSALIETCIGRCKQKTQRKNVILVLVTTGGDADVAYRIARCLQRKYEKVSIYVSGYCKSAGTLVALGGHELIFSDHGELGPLDVQMRKQNNLFEHQSGLTVNASLTAIQDRAFSAFERYFLQIQTGSGGVITVDSAGKMAADITTGIYSGLIAQLDPLHVGEATRAMNIALQYGKMLIAQSGNATEDNLERLISEYPTHSFVIDRTEAKRIFKHVREPDQDEITLAIGLGRLSRITRTESEIADDYFVFINDIAEKVLESRESDNDRDEGNDTENDITGSTAADERNSDTQDFEETGRDVQTDDPDGKNKEVARLKSI